MIAGRRAVPTRLDGVARGNRADFLFALRPLLWIPAIALFEAGRVEGGGAWWPSPRVVPALASLLSLLGAVHLANAWNDRAGDRVNRKGGDVASGFLRGRDLAILGASLMIFTVAAGACPLLSPGSRLALLAALGLGAAYVTPPFEWKRRAGFDLAAQAVGYGLVAFHLGFEASPSAGAPLSSILLRALPYAAGIATVGITTMLADRLGDEAAGQRTTVVTLGPTASRNLALGMAVGTSATGLAMAAWAPSLWGLLALAVISLQAPDERGAGDGRASGDRDRKQWNRIAIVLQMAFVLLLLPRAGIPLLAASGIGIAVTLHDRRRGGLGYPWRAATSAGSGG